VQGIGANGRLDSHNLQAWHINETRRNLMGILATIVVGLIAGWLASMVMKSSSGLAVDLILGVIGGFVGGWLSGVLFGANMMSGINITSIVVAFVGAVIVLFIYRLVMRGP
jgi:uncharacterized membrane protein YeaQ/YmgE (transglycosylase-associated protein family)